MQDKENNFENWALPELEDSEKKNAEETTLFGKPAAWYHDGQEEQENEVVEDEPQPLTIEDIETIRKSAYDDGFNEGKEAGFSQGLSEGQTQGVSEGTEKGLEQGTAEGLIAGQVQIDEQVACWKSLIDRLANPLEKLDDNVEYQLVRLATSLAEQISRCEVLYNPKVILQALKQAVDVLPVNEQRLRILLHPDDLIFVQQAYSTQTILKRGWELQAEPALARGDCQIHTETSSVDYAFSTRINQVLKHFFKENHQRLPEKNDDSSLLNDEPLVEQPESADAEISEQVSAEAPVEEVVAQDDHNTQTSNQE